MINQRVLIVEDDELLLELLITSVEKICPECEVVGAPNGLAALDELQKRPSSQSFDLILTDYNMPAMTGVDLARVVRQTYPETRIVMITGNAFEPKLRAEIETLNLAGFYGKPLSKEQLIEILQVNANNSGERA